MDAIKLIKERTETIALLRKLCGMYGDRNWKDNLHLTDIIEKHLIRHMEDKIETLSTIPR
jgi:hypothetical protein